MNYDALIRTAKSWSNFNDSLGSLKSKEKGDAFSRVVQLYLQTEPEYVTKLNDVWLLDKVPVSTQRKLRLPDLDEGIDLIAKTKEGKYWAIQAKYRTNANERLKRGGKGGLSTFTDLSFNYCRNISFGLVCATTSEPPRKKELLGELGYLLVDTWLSLDDKNGEAWKAIIKKLGGRPTKPKKLIPKKHQKRAIKNAFNHYFKEREARGKLIMPCGTGKSLTAVWIAQKLNAKNIVVCVPSLALIKQSLNVWAREYLAHDIDSEWLCVCSDSSAGKIDQDDFTAYTYALGIDTHTDIGEITDFLKKRRRGVRIIFTTYQSCRVFAKAAKKAAVIFDLAILDEAHQTVGAKHKPFAHLLHDKNFKAKKRLFMTATERVPRVSSDEILSMDDLKIYGETFELLTFKEAIESKPPIICDYKIVTLNITEKEVKQLWQQNRFIRVMHTKLDDVATRSIATGIALLRTMQKYRLQRAITFHGSIPKAKAFMSQQVALKDLYRGFKQIQTFHVSSKINTGKRALLLREFEEANKAIITNARCLNEGVDIPSVDCVVFADPKRSKVDIVQAAGRALRTSEKKEFGYIIIPIVVPDKISIEDFTDSKPFRKVISTICNLATNDERIVDYFRAVSEDRKPSGPIIIDSPIAVSKKINITEFNKAIQLKLWSRVAKINWRTFNEAKNFARSLNFKGQNQWFKYASEGKLPADIPVAVSSTYRGRGWTTWGDFLGTGFIATINRKFVTYDEAKIFAHKLNLNTFMDWNAYCNGEFKKLPKLPDDIPVNPQRTYKKVWKNWGKFLGTGRIATHLRKNRPFNQAREFVHSLGLLSGTGGRDKNKTYMCWRDYKAGRLADRIGILPDDIPADPAKSYRNDWISWPDWLGTSTKPKNIDFMSFNEAHSFASRLGLLSRNIVKNTKKRKNDARNKWRDYCAGLYADMPEKPVNLPASIHYVYKSNGFKGYVNFLTPKKKY